MREHLDITALAVAAILGILLPVCIIYMRQSIKFQRQQLIKDLEGNFQHKKPGKGRDQVIPSFEFVKYKYFLVADSEGQSRTQDVPSYILLLASVPLVICLFVFGCVAISTVMSLAVKQDHAHSFGFERPLEAWNASLIVAYVGGYLFVIRDLLCSVENFDLGPARLLGSALHILFGIATAVLIALGWTLFVPGGAGGTVNYSCIPIFLTAFAVGYVPELGLRALLRASKLWLFKREDTQIYRSFKSTPLEIIDGIDSEIRSRLREFNITTVQHLATANPIMLFVETPYGIYQIFDWVSQAQLCCVVGSKGFTAFGKLGIRTIFDLERAALDPRISTSQLRHEIGRVIFSAVPAGGQQPPVLLNPEMPTADGERNVVGIVEVLLDDLHVQRLRQIHNCVTDRLGRENTRLNAARRGRMRFERSEPPATIRPKAEIAVVAISEARTFAKTAALRHNRIPNDEQSAL
jgi:hypothetical protein